VDQDAGWNQWVDADEKTAAGKPVWLTRTQVLTRLGAELNYDPATAAKLLAEGCQVGPLNYSFRPVWQACRGWNIDTPLSQIDNPPSDAGFWLTAELDPNDPDQVHADCRDGARRYRKPLYLAAHVAGIIAVLRRELGLDIKRVDYRATDARLYPEMQAWLASNPNKKPQNAGVEFAHKADGDGVVFSKARRLAKGYAEWARAIESGPAPATPAHD
jgi:hypothetical protein